MPTYTGPGHATIATGTTPSNHGIIANNWFDRYSKRKTYTALEMEKCIQSVIVTINLT